jgi:hypothetical protein
LGRDIGLFGTFGLLSHLLKLIGELSHFKAQPSALSAGSQSVPDHQDNYTSRHAQNNKNSEQLDWPRRKKR